VGKCIFIWLTSLMTEIIKPIHAKDDKDIVKKIKIKKNKKNRRVHIITIR